MNLAESYTPLPEGSPRPPAISRCDYVRFPATAASPTVNLPSIKGAGPTTPRRDRAKTSFCSATYGPKWHPAIYRDISALVHHLIRVVLSDMPFLIVMLWVRSSSSGLRDTAERSTRCFCRYWHDY